MKYIIDNIATKISRPFMNILKDTSLIKPTLLPLTLTKDKMRQQFKCSDEYSIPRCFINNIKEQR